MSDQGGRRLLYVFDISRHPRHHERLRNSTWFQTKQNHHKSRNAFSMLSKRAVSDIAKIWSTRWKGLSMKTNMKFELNPFDYFQRDGCYGKEIWVAKTLRLIRQQNSPMSKR